MPFFWLASCPIGVLALVFMVYYAKFGSGGLSTDPAVWGQFGDFVGGVVNPIFGFLTLLGIVFTILLQSRQLNFAEVDAELARRASEESSAHLERAAAIQQELVRAQTEANQLSRQRFAEERRPWITVSAKLSSPLTWEEKGLRFFAQLRFRNIGKIPATHFFVEAVASVEGPASPSIGKAMLDHMTDVRSRLEKSEIHGPILFPGEERIENFCLLLFNEDIDKNPKSMTRPRPGETEPVTMFAPFFVGNVAYRYSESEEIHQTGFSYTVSRASERGLAMMLCREDGDIPMELAGFGDAWEARAT